MRFGVMQSVLGKDTDAVFGVAANLGFDGVELDWKKMEEARGTGDLRSARRLAIRRRAENAGVVVSSVCAHWGNQGGIADLNPDTRQKAMAAVTQGITMCAELGAEVLLIPFFGVALLQHEVLINQLTQSLRELAPDAEATGIRLGIESTLPAAQVKRLLDQVSSRAVGSYWDMGNAMWLGHDVFEEIRTLGDRIVAVHAKEFIGSPTPDPSRVFEGLNAVPFGEGMVPVPAVMNELRNAGYDGWITLETGSFGNRFDSAKAALAKLGAALR